jgi:acylphosphatase
MNDGVFKLEVWYSGRVQGVGFRYQTLQIAKGFDVCGWVKNLADGRVHLTAEGSEAEVLAFKEELEDQMRVFIREVAFTSSTGPCQYTGFTISNE